ncbi:MAG TPA: hypothetical protein VFI30_06875 [Nocardioidaceae bacterium]|nr:hypothetical protein [Nocardioidaceae bacterium]
MAEAVRFVWGDTNTRVPAGARLKTAWPARTANLAPLTRFHHRLKTFGGWSVAQPFDGTLVWRSRHGRHYLVDHTGTHRLG